MARPKEFIFYFREQPRRKILNAIGRLFPGVPQSAAMCFESASGHLTWIIWNLHKLSNHLYSRHEVKADCFWINLSESLLRVNGFLCCVAASRIVGKTTQPLLAYTPHARDLVDYPRESARLHRRHRKANPRRVLFYRDKA